MHYNPPIDRRTVNLSDYPDLVVIYLGMRVNVLTGLKTLIGFGPGISGAVDAQPPGLLLHESLIYSLFPPHIGMRQYWRDFESLERWSRSEPHLHRKARRRAAAAAGRESRSPARNTDESWRSGQSSRSALTGCLRLL